MALSNRRCSLAKSLSTAWQPSSDTPAPPAHHSQPRHSARATRSSTWPSDKPDPSATQCAVQPQWRHHQQHPQCGTRRGSVGLRTHRPAAHTSPPGQRARPCHKYPNVPLCSAARDRARGDVPAVVHPSTAISRSLCTSKSAKQVLINVGIGDSPAVGACCHCNLRQDMLLKPLIGQHAGSVSPQSSPAKRKSSSHAHSEELIHSAHPTPAIAQMSSATPTPPQSRPIKQHSNALKSGLEGTHSRPRSRRRQPHPLPPWPAPMNGGRAVAAALVAARPPACHASVRGPVLRSPPEFHLPGHGPRGLSPASCARHSPRPASAAGLHVLPQRPAAAALRVRTRRTPRE